MCDPPQNLLFNLTLAKSMTSVRYSRNVLCTLNYISTFLFEILVTDWLKLFKKKKSPLNLLSELQVHIICLIHSTNDVCEIFYKHSSFYIYLLKMWMLWQIFCFEWLSIFLSNFSFINVKLLKFCSDTSPNEL